MKYLQIIDDRIEQPKHIIKSIQSLREKIDPKDYILITIPYDTNVKEMVRESDRVRFEYACNTKDLCYVDTDCFISYIPEINTDKPFFAKYELSKEDIPDIYYFYVNNNCEYFRNNFKPKDFSLEYSICFDKLRSLKDFSFIPDLSYSHHYTTMKNIINDKKNRDVNDIITKKYISLKKHVELMCLTIKD